MGRHKKYVGDLTKEERQHLEIIAASRISEYRRVIRAKAILLIADGHQIKDVAIRTGMGRKAVRALCKRWVDFGAVKALSDQERPGRPPVLSVAARTWVIELACSCPKDVVNGPARQMWSQASLRDYVQTNCKQKGYPELSTCSKSTIGRILNENLLKPHKMGYYLVRKDRGFEEKAENVLLFYKRAAWIGQMAKSKQFNPAGLTPYDLGGEVFISYDEKPGIQALRVIAPDLLPTIIPGQGNVRRDYEYRRGGTISLLAGMDLFSGELIGITRERHRAKEFIEWLEQVDAKYNENLVINILLDNHSIHRCKKVKEWLAQRPGRFVFIFTPTHASWLNTIEGVFGKLARTGLKHLRVNSKEELCKFIEQWIEEVNKSPVVFNWTWKLENIQGAFQKVRPA